jgi:TamB, inner membrane protein subunit of TAM complex
MRFLAVVALVAICSGCGTSECPCPPSSPISLARDPDVHVLQAPWKTGPRRAPQSHVSVFGHCFRIEHARFDVNPPAEPELNLQASWRSSNGVAVRADITGPYNRAVAHLSSDPPLPETKILALLLEPRTASDARNCPAGKP